MTEIRTKRSLAAVAIRADGTRVPVRIAHHDTVLAKLNLLVLGLLALITDSRRESGGRR